jgi:hypothetical protein
VRLPGFVIACPAVETGSAMADRAEVATRTARVVRDDRGFIWVRIHADAAQSVDDADENLAACESLCRGRMPVLIDIRNAQPLDAKTRHRYSGTRLSSHYTRLALLVDASPLGRMMGNIYLRVANAGVPLRLFGDEADAIGWLREHATT